MKNTHGLFQSVFVAGCRVAAVAFALVARGVSASAQPLAYVTNLLSNSASVVETDDQLPSNDPVWLVPQCCLQERGGANSFWTEAGLSLIMMTRKQKLNRGFFLACFFVLTCAVHRASAQSVTPDYGGNSSVAFDLISGPADNSAWLSSPGTTISLPNLNIGSGPDENLYVALFSQGAALANPWCKLEVRWMDKLRTLTVPGTNDTMYLYFLAHGDSSVQPEFHSITCGWDNASLVALGAVSFKGVQTWLAERHPAVSVNMGSGTQPLIDIRSAPNHMTLAFMMHDTRVAANLTGQTQTQQWAISRRTLNGAVTTAPGVGGSVRHQFTLDTSLSWVVVGIDLPNQPPNIEQRWLGRIRPTGDKLPGGTMSLTLRNFRVGTGANEYMVVGITSPGPLDNLKATWDATCSGCSQDMSEIDAYPIADDSVDYCLDDHVSDAPPGSDLPWCKNFGTSTQPYLYWYGLKLPHPGNKLLTVSWTNDLSGSAEPLVDAMALSFANVNQSTPYKNINYANGTLDGSAGPISLDIMSGSSNDMTVALLGNGGGNIWCNPTQTSSVPSVGHGIDIASSRAPGASGGGIVTHSWMHGEGPADNESGCSRVTATTYPTLYGISGFDIVQAATAPPPGPSASTTAGPRTAANRANCAGDRAQN